MLNTENKVLKRHKAMRLDTSIIQSIEEIAVENNRSFTNMVEVILSEYVKENKNRPLLAQNRR